MAIKTEHCGAKHGDGAYWGRKVIAKAISRKLRRANDKREGDSYYGPGISIKTLWTKQQREAGEGARD